MNEQDRPEPTRDVQSVDAEGRPILRPIEGVIVSAPPVHEDHRGVLVEMSGSPSSGSSPSPTPTSRRCGPASQKDGSCTVRSRTGTTSPSAS